jgi:hypothetical protein
MNTIILLDIDGVLETTPMWRPVQIHADGFMQLNEQALKNLSILYHITKASIVLTTTHRINYDETQWKEIFKNRGLNIETISKINDKTEMSQLCSRAKEIQTWIDSGGKDSNYVIIDDDSTIHALPATIKERWVVTKSMIGFNEEALKKAFLILTTEAKSVCPYCGNKTLIPQLNQTDRTCLKCFLEETLNV